MAKRMKAVVTPVITREEQFETAIQMMRQLFILMENEPVGKVFILTGNILGE